MVYAIRGHHEIAPPPGEVVQMQDQQFHTFARQQSAREMSACLAICILGIFQLAGQEELSSCLSVAVFCFASAFPINLAALAVIHYRKDWDEVAADMSDIKKVGKRPLALMATYGGGIITFIGVSAIVCSFGSVYMAGFIVCSLFAMVVFFGQDEEKMRAAIEESELQQ